jgi:putative peptidoglycan lipid II flippase
LKLITVLLIPAVVGMAVLARPVVELIFEHGETGPEASHLIVAALLLYLPGHLLAGYDQVLIFAFYARKNTLLPVAVGVIASGAYILVAFVLFDQYQMRGLVVANTAQFALHTVLMLWLGRGLVGKGGFITLGRTVARVGIASLLMGAASWGVLQWTEREAGADPTGELLVVAIPVATGIVAYVALARMLGILELEQLWYVMRQRLRRVRP